MAITQECIDEQIISASCCYGELGDIVAKKKNFGENVGEGILKMKFLLAMIDTLERYDAEPAGGEDPDEVNCLTEKEMKIICGNISDICQNCSC